MFIAGIDGGGSHTRLEIRSTQNDSLGRWELGPFNLNSIGEDAFHRMLCDVFTACGDMSQCQALCIGAAGISNPRMEEILKTELSRAAFQGILKLCGDQEIALRGAMDTPGIVLIAGTGSICFGRNRAGTTARSGGFGHLIDDGGSGYALGRDVLSEAVRTADGRSSCQALLDRVYARLGGSSPQDIISFVYAPQTDKSQIAAFSSIALELADIREVRLILEKNAGELAALVSAVQERLGLRGCPVALLGGLLAKENPYRSLVEEMLSSTAIPAAPAHDALWGAAQMAWELTKN